MQQQRMRFKKKLSILTLRPKLALPPPYSWFYLVHEYTNGTKDSLPLIHPSTSTYSGPNKGTHAKAIKN